MRVSGSSLAPSKPWYDIVRGQNRCFKIYFFLVTLNRVRLLINYPVDFKKVNSGMQALYTVKKTYAINVGEDDE